jgi:hypothetical protein
MSERERLEVLRATLDSAAIGRPLALSAAEVDRLFSDGRVCSGFAEVWAAHLFGYQGRRNRNEHLTGKLAADLSHDVQVRVMVRRIKFQPSGNQGKGRPVSQDDVIGALERVETFVVVDVRCWPTINVYPLDTKPLLRAAHGGQLTTNGWSARVFDDWLSRTFTVRLVPVSLTRLAGPPTGEVAA